MISPEDRDRLRQRLGQEILAEDDLDRAAARCMRAIKEEFPHYDWVGIYWLVGDELQLGPYEGAATEHTKIPVGRGVCGTAVAEDTNQVIEDVCKLDNYLSCSVNVRSEIVVLIRNQAGKVLGQIDADGHQVGAFDKSDERMLTEIATDLAALAK